MPVAAVEVQSHHSVVEVSRSAAGDMSVMETLRLDLLKIQSEAQKLVKILHANKHPGGPLASCLTQVADDFIHHLAIRGHTSGICLTAQAVVDTGNEAINVLHDLATQNLVQRRIKRSRNEQQIKKLNDKLNSLVQSVKISAMTLPPTLEPPLLYNRTTTIPIRRDILYLDSSKLPALEPPPKPQVFFGREQEKEALVEALLFHDAAHLAILGPGGMGKTSLATTVLHDSRILNKFSSRGIFLRCDGINSARGLATLLASALNVAADDNSGMASPNPAATG
ncbi:hypothetical protein CALVIDRAFT_569202 [Calocera viscosa TUFC12733]|uniref:NB-ARC domain-containing protein n=1 Tax=Calocera viscosa (strain TUFC12733) TaxID=1330018 RepID=A0A167G806_CALVF|nr:hypothetical protein CALVIDRAFT_569202 [Calocera viscosa TUFC12733]